MQTAAHPPGPLDVDLVVARYREDVDWLLNPPYCQARRIFVYNKGPPLRQRLPVNAREIHLPGRAPPSLVGRVGNVGRCDHTFLFHIASVYPKFAADSP